MKVNSFVSFLVLIIMIASFSEAAKLKSNQKRLLIDKKSKQCFFVESVKKSEKFGWVNDKKAKQISKIKHKKIVTASSEINVRKVFVPKQWCKRS